MAKGEHQVPSACLYCLLSNMSYPTPSRFRKLAIACAASFAFVLGLSAVERPNILFIFSDDHALRTISAYGEPDNLIETPNIDRLANEGAVFLNSFCGNSICQPSRATILTGKHTHKHGVRANGSKWNPNQQLFTRLLSDSGYVTAMIGKWHMHPFPSDEFDYHKTLTGQGGQGRYYNPEFVTFEGETIVEEGYSTDIITSNSIEWMEQRDPGKPFMLMCQYKSPHTNVMPPLRNLHLLADETLPVPESYHNDNAGRSEYLSHTWMRMSGMSAPDVLKHGPRKRIGRNKAVQEPDFYSYMTPEQIEAWRAHYDPINHEYGRRLAAGEVSEKEQEEFPYQRYVIDYLRCVSAIDQNVGRLLDYLDEAGLAENTIVIYSSDQGFFLGENGWTDKRLADDITMKMPFLIRWPGVVKAGLRSELMVQNIDYGPTFLEAAGLEVPGDMDGVSLLPVFDGEGSENWRDSVYYHYYQSGAYNLPKIEAVRNERYKLIRYYGHPDLDFGEQWELFDLEKDPKELISQYSAPEYASVVEMMKSELDALREQYDVK